MTAPGTRRARRPDSVAAAIFDLLGEFETPVPTHAIRILLADRGRAVSAEHLARVAAYEREDFLRTRMPPRLCSVIDVDANAVTPRWWAKASWRLQRRILTEDAKPLWLAMLAERVSWDFAQRTDAVGPEVATLVFWAISQLGLERTFDVPRAPADWINLRSLVVDSYPAVTHSLDSPTPQQHEAEARLKGADVPGVELYFGKSRRRATT